MRRVEISSRLISGFLVVRFAIADRVENEMPHRPLRFAALSSVAEAHASSALFLSVVGSIVTMGAFIALAHQVT
jgi:hypothetical protein